MPYLLSAIFAALAAALAASILVGNDRYRRLRRRLDEQKRFASELLLLLKPMYVRDALARLERAGRTPTLPLEFRSEAGEDLWLYSLFADQPGGEGFYIECGAFDGCTLSVTYAFEALGWTGLLVEPIPERFEACRAARPRSRVVNAALSRRGSTGTASFSRLATTADSPETSSYLDKPSDRSRFRAPPRAAASTITVPLTTMDDALAGHTGAIDFVVLDVEGAELDLLDGFDLDRFRPRALLIEDHAMGRDAALLNHLTARGYDHVCWISYNRLFIRRDDPALLARAKSLAQT